MRNISIFAKLLAISLAIAGVACLCPDQKDLIKPCVCEDNSIYCTGDYEIDLVKVFDSLSTVSTKPSKFFERFILQNAAIKELKENTFKDIRFGEIHIGLCDRLKSVHKNAFNGTDLFTTKLEIFDSKSFSSPDNSIFEALSKFRAIENIKLSNVNITEIPDNAFQLSTRKQPNLTQIYFVGQSFVKLGEKAFESLDNLRVLSFENVNLQKIPENAFAFKKASNVTLILDLSSNKLLNSSVFEVNSLANIKRPTRILFGSSQTKKEITYLDEKVFSPFLADNKNNTIDLLKEEFDCNDCRNKWIRKESDTLSRLLHLSCANGRQFNDPDNFKECTN